MSDTLMIIYNYIYDVENLRLVPIITYTIAAVTSHSLSNLFFFYLKRQNIHLFNNISLKEFTPNYRITASC